MKKLSVLCALFIVFICTGTLHAKQVRFLTAWEACLNALEQLKLDTVSTCTDSLAVRLIDADSIESQICVYDLRMSPGKTISLIYWAEADRFESMRLFGLISSKIRYLPSMQIALLAPYEKVSDIIGNLPRYGGTSSDTIYPVGISSYIKEGNNYMQTTCSESDCPWEEELQAFFDTYFFYKKE